jgi:hypothetical protein
VYAATLRLVPPRSTPIVIGWDFSKSISDHREIWKTTVLLDAPGRR